MLIWYVCSSRSICARKDWENSRSTQRAYEAYTGTADLYVPFIEKGVSLLKGGGIFSYIVAHKWLRADYGKALRQWLKRRCVEEIIDFGDLPVFKSATTYPCIIRIAKKPRETDMLAVNMDTLDFTDLTAHVAEHRFAIPVEHLDDSAWTLSRPEERALLHKIREKGVPLGQYVGGKIFYGIKTGLNKAFVIDAETRDRLIAQDPKSAELIKPFLAGRDIKRYVPPKADKFLVLIPNGWTNARYTAKSDKWNSFADEYPALAAHLEPFSVAAQKRYDKGQYWWELRACEYYAEFEKPNILFPDISLRGNFVLDMDRHYAVNTIYLLPSGDMFLLGLLNSLLLTFFYKANYATFRGGYLRFFEQYLSELPIANVAVGAGQSEARHDKMLALVQRMLGLHKGVQAAKTDHERGVFERQIAATDEEIDRLVYELYGLTDEEIAIVDEATQKSAPEGKKR